MLSLPNDALQLILNHLPARDLAKLKYVCQNLRLNAAKVLSNRSFECITALVKGDFPRPNKVSALLINDNECKEISELNQFKQELIDTIYPPNVHGLIENYFNNYPMRCISFCALIFVARERRFENVNRLISSENNLPILLARVRQLSFCPQKVLQDSDFISRNGISAFFPNSYFTNFKMMIIDAESIDTVYKIDCDYPLKGILLFCKPSVSRIKLNRLIAQHIQQSNPMIAGLICDEICFKLTKYHPKLSRSNFVAVFLQGIAINCASLIIAPYRNLSMYDTVGLINDINRFKQSLKFDSDINNNQQFTVGFFFCSPPIIWSPGLDNLLINLKKIFPKTHIFGATGDYAISGISRFPLNLRRIGVHELIYCDAQLILINFKKS